MASNVRHVTLAELSSRLGMDKSHCRRYVLACGYSFKKTRNEYSGQLVNALTEDDANAVAQLREASGFGTKSVFEAGDGWFYILLIVPELSLCRAKLGFASDVTTRLSAHRTVAPTLELVKAWPCKPAWERAAIDCITNSGCERIGPEVFDVLDIAAAVAKGDEFFCLMGAQD